jgi:hypothetical protein
MSGYAAVNEAFQLARKQNATLRAVIKAHPPVRAAARSELSDKKVVVAQAKTRAKRKA